MGRERVGGVEFSAVIIRVDSKSPRVYVGKSFPARPQADFHSGFTSQFFLQIFAVYFPLFNALGQFDPFKIFKSSVINISNGSVIAFVNPPYVFIL